MTRPILRFAVVPLLVALGVSALLATIAGGSAPRRLIFRDAPARADIPALHIGHSSSSRKPRVLLFTATPATLPAAGGTVKLAALVESAERCRFGAAQKLSSLPRSKRCASGKASVELHLPGNATSAELTYTFSLKVSGRHGKRTAPKVQVRESATGSGGPAPATAVPPPPSTTTTSAPPVTLSAPQITSDPASETVASGQTASFTAAASGNPAPSVQWQISTDDGGTWTEVPGATSATYAFTASANDSGEELRAIFTNSAGSATTAAATLTVATLPQITQQPQDESVVSGEGNASFTATASGSPAPSVQWYQLAAGGTWSAIDGATSTTLSVTAADAYNGNEYEAVFTNAAGSVTTNAATLSVTDEASAPTVTVSPSSETVNAGAQASFTATASGSPTPSVQWQVSSDGTSWTKIDGATSTTLLFTASAGDDGYEYEAVFSNSAGSATSDPATLTVDTAPQVMADPSSDTVASAGDAATFTASASGNPAPSVQWYQLVPGDAQAQPITNATSTTLDIDATADLNGDLYYAVFTNAAGSATTTAATLSIEGAPQVTAEPTDATVAIEGSLASNDSTSFSASASGDPTIAVQWQVSSDGGNTWGDIGGATSSTYTVSSAAASENGYEYRAVFTNGVASATTDAATLTVAQTTGNWSGYVATGSAFIAVSGSWTVPAVTCSGSTTYSAHWIGIDGDNDQTVEQDGTEADCSRGGTASYDAWYEMYGDDAVDNGNEVELPSGYGVAPGDAMSASISVSANMWTLEIADGTQGWTYTTPQIPFTADQSSAEWIGERPELCGIRCTLASLSNFGSLTFTGATATTGGGDAEPLSSFSYAPLEMVNGSHVLAAPGPLDPTGESFTDTWYASS